MHQKLKNWLIALVASGAIAGRPAVAGEKPPSAELPVHDRFLLRRLDLASRYLDAPMLAALQEQDADATLPGKGSTAAGEPPAFDVPAGRLKEALAAFEKQSGFDVEVQDPLLLDIKTKGVSGVHAPEKALEVLLEGTGVAFERRAPGRYALALRVSKFVDVSEQRDRQPESPKFTEPLRNIPQTITIVPKAVIEDQNATTLRDVLRNVTGISLQAGEGGVPAGDNLTIRGFSGRTDIFVDGFRDFGGYARDPFNVEQVEVSKGPASTFTGRGSTGGTVNLASKSPAMEAFRGASLGFGTEEYKRGTFDLNFPFPSFALQGTALRLNAMYTDADVSGRDVAHNRRFGFAPSLAFGLGTPTRVTASYSRLVQDNVPDYGLPWVPDTNLALPDHVNEPPPVDFSNFYGLSARDYEETTTDIATLELQRDFGPSFTLTNLTRYGRNERDSIITAPRFESDESTAIRRTDWKSRDQVDDILGNQLNLVYRFSTGAVKHSVASGLELSSEDSVNHTRAETGVEAGTTDLFDPDPSEPYAGSIRRDGGRNESDAFSTALYAFDTLEFGERWQATAGLRWERFDLDYRVIDAEGVEESFSREDDMLSWRAGVIHRPRPNGSVYLGAGTSFNPSSEGLTLSESTAGLPPERSFSVEVGTKWDLFERRLNLSAAVFRTEKVNARTPGVNPGDPATVLDGESQVNGLELGVAGQVHEKWTLFAGYTLMSSEITESNNPDEEGNEFGNTPRNSLTVWSSHPFTEEFEAGVSLRYVGDRYTNGTATRQAPAYWLLDAMVSYRVNELLTLRLNGHNLANETYIDRVGGGHFIPGEERTAILTGVLDF